MKTLLHKLAVLYGSNRTFHSLVTAVEYGAGGALISATAPGVSFTRGGLTMVGTAVLGGAVGAARGWLMAQTMAPGYGMNTEQQGLNSIAPVGTKLQDPVKREM